MNPNRQCEPTNLTAMLLCVYVSDITGDIILYDGRLAVYRHSLDLIFYLIANQDENELMINTALSAFSDAVQMLLRNQVEKRAVLENLDLVLLCLDETIDEGCVTTTTNPPSVSDDMTSMD